MKTLMTRIFVILLSVFFFSGLFFEVSADTQKQTNEQKKAERKKERDKKREARRKADEQDNTPKTPAKKNDANTDKKTDAKGDKKAFKAPPMKKNGEPKRPEGTLKCVEKEFTLPTGIATEPEVKLTCIVPVDASGNPTEGANDMVFYSPYAGARKALEKRPELRRYANALGMTIFTVEITTDTKYLGDEQKYYCYAVSGWHEVAIKAREKIMEEFKLENRKMLIVGDSVGGSYAQQIAARYPGLVDAAAFAGGRLFGEIKKNDISWLILSTWECPGMANSQTLAREYALLGMNVLQTETPPILPGGPADHLFHHVPSLAAMNLLEDYLSALRDMRKKNGGRIPPSKDWPVKETILGKDYSFPSAAVAEGWKKLPNGMRSEIAQKELLPIVLEPEKPDNNSKVVIYAHDPEVHNTILEDNMCFIALQGDYAVALRAGANMEDYQRLCEYVKEQFPRRDIYVVGTYDSGEDLAAGVLASGLKVKKITLLNTDAESLSDTLDENRSKLRGKSKILILEDEKTEGEQKYKHGIEVKTFNKSEEFGNQWFNAVQRGMYDEE